MSMYREREHVLGWPIGHQPPVVQEQDARKEMACQGEIVEHRDDRDPIALVELLHKLHDSDLVAQIHEDAAGQ